MRDVIVLGAGPAGLATAAELRRAGVDVELFDRTGDVGGAYARMDPALVMTSPASLIALPGAGRVGGTYATARAYRDYLIAYARERGIAPTRATASNVARERDGYRVTADGSDHAARTVVVATGTYDHPYVPLIAGSPSVPVEHAAVWRTGQAARGERVLIVGGASSAIEIAEDVARSGGHPTLATRRISVSRATWLGVDPAHVLFPLFRRISPHRFCAGAVTVPGVDRGYHALVARGAIVRRGAPTRIDGNRAELEHGGPIEIDRVVFATGYRWTAPFLPADLACNERGVPRCHRNESVSHPGLYIVGAPCARSAASQYLYGIARDAADVADHIVKATANAAATNAKRATS